MKIKSKFIVVVFIISILLILFAWLAIGNANKGFLNLSNVHQDSKEVQVLELVTGNTSSSKADFQVEPMVAPKVKTEEEAQF